MGEREMITPRTFIFNVLNGVALAIVVGMIPNAILGELSKYLGQYNDIFTKIAFVTQGIQYSIPILTGILIAAQFGLTQLQTAVTGAAAFVGSGASTFVDNKWVIVGIGDLINTMITASIAVGIILLIGNKLGSLNMIVLPIVGGAVAGLLGLLILPYTKLITLGLGDVINGLTNTQPIIMTVLIAMIFSILIVSPISSIGIGLAIGISGLAAGSAAVGVSASAIMLAVGSWRVNKPGVSGFVGGLLNIKGTPDSAGFGLIGLVGPIKSLNLLDMGTTSGLLIIAITYIIVPLISALFFHYLFTKVLKLYDPNIFKYKV